MADHRRCAVPAHDKVVLQPGIDRNPIVVTAAAAAGGGSALVILPQRIKWIELIIVGEGVVPVGLRVPQETYYRCDVQIDASNDPEGSIVIIVEVGNGDRVGGGILGLLCIRRTSVR